MQDNPYATPKSNLDTPVTEAESIRREHLSHEASIKALGFLYYLSGGALTLGGIAMLMPAILGGVGPSRPEGESPAALLGFALLLIALAAATIATAYGLRRLRPWVRIPVGILSGLGLLNVPIGTLFNAYFLYLVFSRKGRLILSNEYAEIVAQTPDIRYRTPIVIWIILALLILLVGAAFLIPYFSRVGG